MMTRHGLWIDDPVGMLLTETYWRELAAHGIRTAAIMLEPIGEGFNPKYDLDELRRVRDHALAYDVEIVLTTWPEPDERWLAEFAEKIGTYLEAAGAAGLETDDESNWTAKKVVGFPSIDAAGDRLVEVLQAVRRMHDVRIELTTFTMHAENGPKADVAPHVDRLVPQAYSVRNRGIEPVDPVAFGDLYGPGRMQELTLGRARQIKGPKLACGLAAYDQIWPGRTGEQAMRVAYDAARAYEPVEIRFWSSKHVLGVRANGYASRFLKSIAT